MLPGLIKSVRVRVSVSFVFCGLNRQIAEHIRLKLRKVLIARILAMRIECLAGNNSSVIMI